MRSCTHAPPVASSNLIGRFVCIATSQTVLSLTFFYFDFCIQFVVLFSFCYEAKPKSRILISRRLANGESVRSINRYQIPVFCHFSFCDSLRTAICNHNRQKAIDTRLRTITGHCPTVTECVRSSALNWESWWLLTTCDYVLFGLALLARVSATMCVMPASCADAAHFIVWEKQQVRADPSMMILHIVFNGSARWQTIKHRNNSASNRDSFAGDRSSQWTARTVLMHLIYSDQFLNLVGKSESHSQSFDDVASASMNHPVDKITEQICAHIFVICINLLRISLRMQRWLSVRYCLWTSNELTFQLNFRKHKHIEPSKRIPNHYCFIVWSTPLQRFHVSQFMRGRNEYIYIYISRTLRRTTWRKNKTNK